MSEQIVKSRPDEQEICMTCGFCCDGTIFGHGHLKPGEKESIPHKMRENLNVEIGENYFPQPCPYFDGVCTIYCQRRPEVCCTYRCQLLKEFKAGKIKLNATLKIVAGALEMRRSIMDEYMSITGYRDALSFRKLLMVLGKLQKSSEYSKSETLTIELLAAKCNIFEALLIKNFRSSDDFSKLVMK